MLKIVDKLKKIFFFKSEIISRADFQIHSNKTLGMHSVHK